MARNETKGGLTMRPAKWLSLVLAFLLLPALAGCGKPGGEGGPDGVGRPGTAGTNWPDASGIDRKLTTAYNAFGMKLLLEISEQEKHGGSVLLSPSSIAIALSMTMNGARADTLKEMGETIAGGMSPEDVNESNETLLKLLASEDPKVRVHAAQSLWAREGKPFHDEFLQTNERFYDARIEQLDFDDPGAVDTINDWVKQQTEGAIDRLIEGPIDKSTVMFLLQAIYFKGDWKTPFPEAATSMQPFRLEDGTTADVPLMSRQNELFDYLRGDGFQAVKLPYGDGRWSMIVALPDNEKTGLAGLLPQLAADPSVWTTGYEQMEGSVWLPKFRLESELELRDALKAMGMPTVFNPSLADLSGMADVPPNLYIFSVRHKSFIDVNETGTEASAATSVEVRGESARIGEPFVLRADRPFFFAIMEESSGTIVFAGTMYDPSASPDR